MQDSLSNKKIGNQVEKEFAQFMYQQGWWIHILAYNQNGQPFDAVMTRGNITWFLDVKNETDDYFPLSRIEPNQRDAFEMLLSKKTDTCGLAIKMPDGNFYLLPYKKIKQLEFIGVSKVNKNYMLKM